MRAEILEHISAEMRIEEKECLLYRRGAEARISKMELLQGQILEALKRRGVELGP
jgi:hypothetical protein